MKSAELILSPFPAAAVLPKQPQYIILNLPKTKKNIKYYFAIQEPLLIQEAQLDDNDTEGSGAFIKEISGISIPGYV